MKNLLWSKTTEVDGSLDVHEVAPVCRRERHGMIKFFIITKMDNRMNCFTFRNMKARIFAAFMAFVSVNGA